jgi:GT2 family glycosyltransferase
MTDVAVVVPTYRRPEGLRRLLSGLEGQTLPRHRWEVVIFDDASGPGISEQIDALAAESPLAVRVVHGRTNQGQAVARNEGWRATSAAVVAFTDDDCVPRPGWLQAGLETMVSAPRLGVVQGRTVRPEGHQDYAYTLRTVVREVLEPSPWFEGCNLFVRREALDAVGGFDEELSDFAEDTALGWAVLERGWERGWSPDALVEHELSERPWFWHLRFYFLQGRIVDIAKRYPQIRGMFWRPWAVGPDNAYFALAVAGLALLPKRRASALLVVPYLAWLFGPRERRPTPGRALRIGVFKIATNAASFTGKTIAAVRTRTFLL